MSAARDCFVTIDAGTGSGRCVVLDRRGVPLASAGEPFHYRVIEDPNVPMLRGFDLDAPAFWSALVRSVRTALRQLPAEVRIRGVAVTSQREACVFVDRAGEVLYAGPNLDARAVMEGIEAQEAFGAARLHALTGHAPPYIFGLPRYLWFRKHHDERQITHFLMLSDWITYRLSGEVGAEPSNASESLLFDVTRCTWSAEILDAFQIPRAILPPVRPCGSRVGVVTPTAAAETGLPAGTPVFVGGADTECALLGTGVHEVGQTGAILGTTTPVQMVLGHPLIDPQGNLWTSCHVVPRQWVLESNAGDTGGAFRWLLEVMFGSTDEAAHASAEAAMVHVGLSPRPIFCHFGPVIFDLSNMHPFRPAGMLFRFPLLHVDRPTRGEVLHAYVESIAHAVRGNVEQIVQVATRPVPELWVSGGLSQSPTLLAALANTLGVPLRVAQVPESASVGCAILAAVGSGLYASLAEAASAMTAQRVVEPVADQVSAFDERYRQWREVYGLLQTWQL